jgi:hypothetical protein
LAGVFETLMGWRRRAASLGLPRALPEWLMGAFAAASDRDEKSAWLARWRTAEPEANRELERSHGWEFEQWAYWFSAENDVWWVDGVARIESNEMVVRIWHVDDTFPRAALEWLIERAGGTVRAWQLVDPGG